MGLTSSLVSLYPPVTYRGKRPQANPCGYLPFFLFCISVPHIHNIKMIAYPPDATLSAHSYKNLTLNLSHLTTHHFFETNILKSPSLYHLTRLQRPTARLQVSSRLSLLAFLSVPKSRISKFCAKKMATLLLGSLVFMGFLKSRPVLAIPVQEIERLEQRRDAGCEKNIDGEEEVMCLKLLHENPANTEALMMVVNVKMKGGKTNEAVEFVERLIELQPNEMEWRLLQALCYETMGDLTKAKSLFENILKQKPLLLRALHGLAMVMHKNHEGRAVFEMLQEALEVAQRDKRVDQERNISILVAQMHVVKGDLEEALAKFQALIDENPRDFRPYLCQGIIYSLLDRRNEAEQKFEIYRSLVPEDFPQRGFLDDVVLAAKTEPKR